MLFFRPSIEDYVKSKELLKSVVQQYLPGRMIFPVPGDGLCAFHAFRCALRDEKGIDVTLDEMKDSLKAHIIQKQDHYEEVHYQPWKTLLTDIDLLFKDPLKNYNTDSGDLFLFALGVVYSVNVYIVKTEQDDYRFSEVCQFGFPHTIYLARSLSIHIDPIIRMQQVCFDMKLQITY